MHDFASPFDELAFSRAYFSPVTPLVAWYLLKDIVLLLPCARAGLAVGVALKKKLEELP